MLRFSLAGLFAIVSISALGCAAVVNPTDLWRQVTVTLIVAALLAATVAVFFAADRLRGFTGGFAIAGWLYFALAFVAALGLRDDLLTDRAVAQLVAAIHSKTMAAQGMTFTSDGQLLVGGTGMGQASYEILVWDALTGQRVSNPAGRGANFRDIGHALWTFIVGCLGGALACLLKGKRQGPSNRVD
jgi:hypothetical protein